MKLIRKLFADIRRRLEERAIRRLRERVDGGTTYVITRDDLDKRHVSQALDKK